MNHLLFLKSWERTVIWVHSELSTKSAIPDFKPKRSHNYYQGSRFTRQEIKQVLEQKNVIYSEPEDFPTAVAEYLAQQKIIGWFQGGG